jgi:phospholipid transport system substrate-binding protein
MILAAMIIGTAAFQTSYATKTDDPTTVIEQFNAKLLEAMKGGEEAGYTGRYRILEPVIREVFAFNLIVRISSGNYWPSLSNGQRQRLIELYRQWSTAVYAQRYDSFNGQYFKIISSAHTLDSKVSIDTQMIKKNGDTVSFFYKLINIKGQWKIVDIHVKGISQLATTRAQFISVLRRDGFDGLEKLLLEKINTSQAVNH